MTDTKLKERICTEMLGSCIGVAVLAILYEGLKVLRDYIDAKCRCTGQNASCGGVQECSDNGSKSMSTDDSRVDVRQTREQYV